MSQLGTKFHLQRHEDDQWFDAVSVKIEERWKYSGLSGSEWRFTYVATFYRKGVPLARRATSRLDWALSQLPSMIEDLAPVGDDDALAAAWNAKSTRVFGHPDPCFEEFCAQPGCKMLATVEYRLAKSWCNRCGSDREPPTEQRRRFCEEHKIRGDCGLDDADANYTLARMRTVDYDPLMIRDWKELP